jgi:hypothetical protein
MYEIVCLRLQSPKTSSLGFSRPEDGGSTSLRNVGRLSLYRSVILPNYQGLKEITHSLSKYEMHNLRPVKEQKFKGK